MKRKKKPSRVDIDARKERFALLKRLGAKDEEGIVEANIYLKTLYRTAVPVKYIKRLVD